eukprot:TRINITY_DN12_c3_g1_i1.p1 TRINITY_DN12_c3_g1~~TRINITY_DN12_c3_g1_i1.p1  ORF type:complete len:809 (+),score=191.51 TRINITY_DN12_c3_g1_i1:123-2549(+)
MGNCCNADDKEDQIQDEDDGREVDQMMRDLGAGDESSTVLLTIAARNLSSGASNPMIYVFEKGSASDNEFGTYIGNTESINSSSPQFVKTISIGYQFASVQNIIFVLVSEEKKGGGFDVQPRFGTCTITLPELVNTSPYMTALISEKNSKVGDIIINSEEARSDMPQYEIMFTFGCKDIESKNLFGANGSDPFLRISRVEGGSFIPVAKTEHFDGVLECVWKPTVIKLDKLCKSDFNSWILLEVFDWESSGKHQMIGSARTTLAIMLAEFESQKKKLSAPQEELPAEDETGEKGKKASNQKPKPLTWELINSSKVGKPKYVSSGDLFLLDIEVSVAHSFLEYVKGGFDINLTICVDFSSSNRQINDPTSLHYLNPQRNDNEYLKALRSVVAVLGEYDKDQEFPFYGFGAQVPQMNSDCFPVTFDINKVEVEGIEGIVTAYWNCLSTITMSEPTNFRGVLQTMRSIARRSIEAYQIVLIVTDGGISDLQETIDVIVSCSDDPISVLIIGVGDDANGTFDDMETLDGDDKPLMSTAGKTANRDLVGFVPYRQHKDSPEALARATLMEIPNQFSKWAKLRGVKPPEKTPEAELLQQQEQQEQIQLREAARRGNLPLDGEEVTAILRKREAADGIGLKVEDMTIHGVTSGTAAAEQNFYKYEGYLITHVNGIRVHDPREVGPIASQRPIVKLTMRRNPNYEPRGSSEPSERGDMSRNGSRFISRSNLNDDDFDMGSYDGVTDGGWDSDGRSRRRRSRRHQSGHSGGKNPSERHHRNHRRHQRNKMNSELSKGRYTSLAHVPSSHRRHSKSYV